MRIFIYLFIVLFSIVSCFEEEENPNYSCEPQGIEQTFCATNYFFEDFAEVKVLQFQETNFLFSELAMPLLENHKNACEEFLSLLEGENNQCAYFTMFDPEKSDNEQLLYQFPETLDGKVYEATVEVLKKYDTKADISDPFNIKEGDTVNIIFFFNEDHFDFNNVNLFINIPDNSIIYKNCEKYILLEYQPMIVNNNEVLVSGFKYGEFDEETQKFTYHNTMKFKKDDMVEYLLYLNDNDQDSDLDKVAKCKKFFLETKDYSIYKSHECNDSIKL